MQFFNTDSDSQSGTCALSTAPLDIFHNPNFGRGDLRLPPAGTEGFNQGRMTLIGTTTFLINSTITVSCTGFGWVVQYPAIMATKVGALH
jgi:hypothetical protein